MLTTRRPRRLVSIAHSYCVALNRRLAHEMARAGGNDWEVTAVAPSFFKGELRPIKLEEYPGEQCKLESVPAHATGHIHFMVYGGRLHNILRQSWDVVHCWEEPFIFAGGQVAMWKPRGAALVFATFQNIQKHYPPPFSWIERYAMNKASGWIAFGHTVDQSLASRPAYSTRPRRTIPLGVDLDVFQPNQKLKEWVRSRLGWEGEGPPVVGILGRFVPEKGFDILMHVLDQLPTSWRALFVGNGLLEKELRRWGALHGDRVRVLTGVKHDEVPAYLNAMDILCAPSQTTPNWREQLGRMLIEAFACGVPVIASASGEIPYVVGDAGVIVGEKDEAGWVKALEVLLEDSSYRMELSRRGLERAQTTYAWPIIARQHLDFFDELLDSNRPTGD